MILRMKKNYQIPPPNTNSAVCLSAFFMPDVSVMNEPLHYFKTLTPNVAGFSIRHSLARVRSD